MTITITPRAKEDKVALVKELDPGTYLFNFEVIDNNNTDFILTKRADHMAVVFPSGMYIPALSRIRNVRPISVDDIKVTLL